MTCQLAAERKAASCFGADLLLAGADPAVDATVDQPDQAEPE